MVTEGLCSHQCSWYNFQNSNCSIAVLSLRQIAFLEVLIGKENTQVCSGFVTSDSCGIPLLAKNWQRGSFLSPLTVLI